MKKLFFFSLLTFLMSCQLDQSKNVIKETNVLEVGFEMEMTPNAELIFENLKLLPIIATSDFIQGNENLESLQGLSQAIENKKFRITEKKPYGRQNDQGAVNELTVLNKSEDPVFLMAGDVVQGGNQDRVIAEDRIIAAKTITDISVFCVEKNRWTPHEAEENTGNKKFAFNGYYNTASCSVRKSVTQSRNQQEIWEAVANLTSIHNAKTSTGTYAGLEQSEDFTRQRDAYLRFFENKFDEAENVVGIVAVSGSKILGADVFGHPNLFSQQYASLLHSYVTEAISNGDDKSEPTKEAYRKYNSRLRGAYRKNSKTSLKFTHDEKFVHLTNL